MKTTSAFFACLAFCTASAQTLSMVKDINPGGASSNVREPFIFNDRFLYVATNAEYGAQVYSNHACLSCYWNSTNPKMGANPRSLTSFTDKPIFISPATPPQGASVPLGDRIWCENTTAIYQHERNIQHAAILPYAMNGISTIREITKIGNKLWLSADVGGGLNIEPYWTMALGNILPQSTSLGQGYSALLLRDINPNGSSEPRNFTEFNGKVIFSATDGTKGTELWVTDGTSTGTLQIKDINPGSGGVSFSKFVRIGAKLYFTARINGNTELWCTDATTAGTTRVKDINPTGNDQVGDPVVWKNALYFSATNGTNGVELWRSDGTAAGTLMLKDINATGNSSPSDFSGYGYLFGTTAAREYLAFAADNGSVGKELWRTDGTTAGTVLLKDINPGIAGSSPRELVAMAGYYYYSAIQGTNGRELMQFAPINNNHTRLAPMIASKINPLGMSNAWPWIVFKNELYFYANYDSNGGELWKLTPRP